MWLPLSVQRYSTCFDICQVFDAFTVGIAGSAAIGVGVPAGKGVARPGVGIVCQVVCNVKGHWLVTHTAAVRSIAVILDGIVVGPPLSVQCYHVAICSCQVLYILTVAIGSSRTVRLGIPAGKGVPRFGIAVGRQVGCRIVGHGLIGHAAAIGGITLKLYRILMRFPESVKSIVISVYRSNIICSIGMAGTITFGVP